ncbi:MULTISPECIES: DAK2 domain-containing protein [unclassified Mesorhizobium]|uniref:DAK2 domain-containing protein n=1 Tax=unclassified Mesorhizobium TaxID=325217 RepID=UPI000FD7F5EC|nr:MULTISPECIES: DAK2 domain-containing protein [unclassified Mesorhizobium]TGT71875.1 DAK2 domain-containing protein [Mesorhizobium sp. M2E.F.Ca.ET.166.01.1.1]TGV99410.1 DAK2 domain-containing protein [Mesorhizobium sp. M2E.F.Ca.ET.154.01.1.1]
MITAATLHGLAVQANAAMHDLEQELNMADAALGDGDTGGMLARVIERLAAVTAAEGDDLGKTFGAYAQATTAATGSSLGTLFATALLVIGKATRGRTTLAACELGPILAEVRDAMLLRGQSQLGDKTVVDAIDAVSKATVGKSDWAGVAAAAQASAAATLASFRDQPCKIGRARMFGDKSRGLDDPGMLAFVRLLSAISSKTRGE